MNRFSEQPNKRIIQGLTWVGALAGLGLGLVALLAPAGVWTGLWEFGTGFTVLGAVNSVAAWITLACALIAVALFVMARQTGNIKPGLVVAVATLAAALAWLIPESYRPEQDIPPIHDISTDTENPPEFVDVVELRGPGTNPLEYGAGEDMTPERLANLQQEAYPEIEPQIFDASPAEVYQRALQAARDMGWDIVAEAPGEGRIEATDTTFWFRFKDDIVIRITETEDGTRLDARSVSRVGRSDVGKNAERLRNFFAELRQNT